MVIWNSVFLKGVLKIILRKLRLFKIQAIAQGVARAVARKKSVRGVVMSDYPSNLLLLRII